MTKWITTTQLAKELQVSDRTIRYWAVSGEVPAHRVGALFRFRRDEIEAWLSSKKISRPETFHWPAETGSPKSVAPKKEVSGGYHHAEIMRLLEKRRQKARRETSGQRRS